MENYHKYMKIKDTVDTQLKSEKVKNLIEYCERDQCRFKDAEFPPEMPSLIGNPPANDYNG